MTPNAPKPQVNIDINQTDEIICDACGHNTFLQSFLIRKVGAILSPTGMPGLMPVPVFECSACGGVNNIFLPQTEKE